MRKIARGTLSIICLLTCMPLFGGPLAEAQKDVSPDVPEAIRAPLGQRVALVAHGSGSQIYSCQSGANGNFTWSLKGPDAELTDAQGKVIGKHFAGPKWKLMDGSEITGKAVAHVNSPDPGSVPWLLLNAVAHAGNGLLTTVTTIQRVHTQGGQPPADGCDKSHVNTDSKISYTADYYFYAPAK